MNMPLILTILGLVIGVLGVYLTLRQTGIYSAEKRKDNKDKKLNRQIPEGDPFVGRLEAIKDCLNALLIEDAAVILSGLPGMGKTELALEVNKQLKARSLGFPDGTLWMSVGRYPDISARLAEWCSLLDVSCEDELKEKLKSRRMLLVFDDVWSGEDAAALLSLTTDSCGCMMTTHEQKAVTKALRGTRSLRFREITLNSLEPDEALTVLKARAGLGEASEEVNAFLSEDNVRILLDLCNMAEYIPFTVAMMGAHLAGEVAPLEDGAGERLKDFQARLRGARGRFTATLPFDARKHPGYAERFKRSEISPEDLMSLVADGLEEGERQVLDAVSILLPNPDSFTAAQVARLLEPAIAEPQAQERLGRLIEHDLVHAALPLTEDHAHDENGAGPEPERRYTVHQLVAWCFVKTLRTSAPDQLISLRERAVRLFGNEIEPTDKESGAEDGSRKLWRSAHRLETPEWQAAASQWIHQLAQLDDRLTARVAFDRVYLDTVWWWRCYLEDELPRRLIDGWIRANSDDDEFGSDIETRSQETEWIAAVKQFHQAYRPAQEKWAAGETPPSPKFKSRWSSVRAALETIARLDGLDGEPRSPVARHAAALLDIFIAEAVWRADPPDHYADEMYDRAAKLLEGCSVPDCDCEWSLPWISWHLADVELGRGHRSLARDHANEGLKLALTQAGDSLEEVLENWEDDLACELVSNCFRARADAVWQDDAARALGDYQQACLFAFAFQYRPHVPDDYTVAFYGEMIARILDRIGRWSEAGKDKAFQTAVEGLVTFGRESYPIDPDHADSLVPTISATNDSRSEALLVQAFAPRPEPSRAGLSLAKAPPLPDKLEGAITDAITSLYHELIPDAATVG